jgi:hypothetical protein
MAAAETIGQKYHVETSDTDWPKSLTMEERAGLVTLTREALARFGAKGAGLYEIERMVSAVNDTKHPAPIPIFRKAALWDFRYACIERALRAIDAEPRWHAKGE